MASRSTKNHGPRTLRAVRARRNFGSGSENSAPLRDLPHYHRMVLLSRRVNQAWQHMRARSNPDTSVTADTKIQNSGAEESETTQNGHEKFGPRRGMCRGFDGSHPAGSAAVAAARQMRGPRMLNHPRSTPNATPLFRASPEISSLASRDAIAPNMSCSPGLVFL